jgi:hypothetical protein
MTRGGIVAKKWIRFDSVRRARHRVECRVSPGKQDLFRCFQIDDSQRTEQSNSEFRRASRVLHVRQFRCFGYSISSKFYGPVVP